MAKTLGSHLLRWFPLLIGSAIVVGQVVAYAKGPTEYRPPAWFVSLFGDADTNFLLFLLFVLFVALFFWALFQAYLFWDPLDVSARSRVRKINERLNYVKRRFLSRSRATSETRRPFSTTSTAWDWNSLLYLLRLLSLWLIVLPRGPRF